MRIICNDDTIRLPLKFTEPTPSPIRRQPQETLMEIAKGVGPVQDGRMLINWPFLHDLKGSPAEYKAGLDLAIARGRLWKHESCTYVKLTHKVAVADSS